MSTVNSKIISDSNFLAHDILNNSTDSVESKLNRTQNRVTGAIVGLLTLGWPMGVFLADASTDKAKLKELQSKLTDLSKTDLNKNDPDYNKALSALNFQTETYKDIADYTDVAKKIKLITGAGFAVASIGLIAATRKPSSTAIAIMDAGFKTGLGGAVTKGLHSLFYGSELEEANKARASSYMAASK